MFWYVEARRLLAAARAASGLTQEAVARRAQTSQPALSAYERGRKSPKLDVVERILKAMGWELDLVPRVTFEERALEHGGRQYYVPNRLWRLTTDECFAPLDPGCRPPLGGGLLTERNTRIAGYIWLLEHGSPADLIAHLDGALLVEGWPEIQKHLHPRVRDAWEPVIWASTSEEWLIDALRAGALYSRPPLSQRALRRTVRRLADRGLTAGEIRELLRTRPERRGFSSARRSR